jgi:antitoxin component HigA of HigAB toxin-antitoxin module
MKDQPYKIDAPDIVAALKQLMDQFSTDVYGGIECTSKDKRIKVRIQHVEPRKRR